MCVLDNFLTHELFFFFCDLCCMSIIDLQLALLQELFLSRVAIYFCPYLQLHPTHAIGEAHLFGPGCKSIIDMQLGMIHFFPFVGPPRHVIGRADHFCLSCNFSLACNCGRLFSCPRCKSIFNTQLGPNPFLVLAASQTKPVTCNWGQPFSV